MSNKQNLLSALEAVKRFGEIPVDVLEKLTEDEEDLITRLQNQGLVDGALRFLEDMNTDQELNALKNKLAVSRKQHVPVWKSVAKYAAIFIGLLSVVYFYRISQMTDTDNTIAEESIRLKIGDDVIKVIREGESQKILSASGKVIGEQKGNKIKYDSNAEINELVYNELEIPYGKVFDVELSDGTLVHLNSGTKMRYPIQFLKGHKREVFIEGEAYYSVTKDKEHPFIVHADAVEVEVLGTEFNISSYKEDHEIRTVLVEGSVSQSSSLDSNESVTLKPGQKASWNKTNYNTEIEEVDVNMYTGWITGELVFRNSSFESMAKKLERRYDISILNHNLLLKDKRLNARFNVNVENIEDVLKSINEIQAFEYKISGRKVVID